uniref:Uncharacterized protein n=1 Tax=Nelumbo nucifera TaxID=4432 RepID=A0A822ZDB6_NELNU|nr:TPA_asm: hypothetical protein HUJ06_015792 [Nelumbo nucifera]
MRGIQDRSSLGANSIHLSDPSLPAYFTVLQKKTLISSIRTLGEILAREKREAFWLL